MIMVVAPGVVAGRAVAGGQLGRQAAGHQGFERLVDGRQADLGDRRLDALIDFLGGGMVLGPAEVVVDGQPLGRAAPAGRLEGGAERRHDRAEATSSVGRSVLHASSGTVDAEATTPRSARDAAMRSELVPLFGRLTVLSTAC